MAGLVLALGLALAAGRVGRATVQGWDAGWAMTDFYSSAYYPVLAVLDGVNPHDFEQTSARYPVTNRYGPHLPLNLVLHYPFALLAPPTAAFVYFVLSVLLTLVLAMLALRLASVPATGHSVCLVAGLLLLSRPGQWALLLGQPAIFLTVLTYATLLLLRQAPRWAPLALAVASYKPNFGVLLALILLVAGHLRVVVAGAVIGLLLNLPLVVWVAERVGGLSALADSIARGYRQWQTIPVANPATSPWLVDAASFFSRFLGHSLSTLAQVVLALGIVGAAGIALRRLEWDDPAERNVGIGIVCTALLAAGHHLGYDLVLLTAPAIAVATGRLPAAVPRWLRWSLAALLVVPALNWVVSVSVLKVLPPSHTVWLLVTSTNAFCLLMLFLGHLGMAFAYRGQVPRPDTATGEPQWA